MAKKATELGGFFLYQEEGKGHATYYDIFTKRGYFVNDSDVKRYSKYTTSVVISGLIALMIPMFLNNYTYDIGLGIAFFLLMFFVFRAVLIKSLVEDVKFVKPKKDNIFVNRAKKNTYSNLVFLSVMCVLIQPVVYLGAMNKKGTLDVYIYVVVGVVSFIILILTLVSLIIKKKNNY